MRFGLSEEIYEKIKNIAEKNAKYKFKILRRNKRKKYI